MRDEEKKRYKEVMVEAKKDDEEFRKRSESDRRKRITVRNHYPIYRIIRISI